VVTRARRSSLDLVLLAVAVAAVSTAAPLVREADAPTLAVAFWRTGLAVPATGALLLSRHRGELRALDAASRRRSLLAGVWLAGHFAAWIPSLSFTTVASSVALVSTTPVWAALLARRDGEDVPRAAWRGIGLALAGVVVLTGVDFAVTPRAVFGDGLALVGGVLAAVYLRAGAAVRQVASTALYTTLCYGVAAVVLLAVCLVGRQQVTGYDGRTWLILLAMTAGPQLLGHTLLNRVVATTGSTVVAVAILGEIVGSALLAWAFFDEVPPATAIPAAALLATGIVLVVRSTMNRSQIETSPMLGLPNGQV
jgi:drug/metabolite transporter (DMT)-like permease